MKRKAIFYFVWTSFVITTLLFSCSKEDVSDSVPGKQVALSVSLIGINESDETTEITRGDNNIPATQTVTVSSDNGMTLEATLERNASGTTRGTTALATGVKYRVIAYKQDNISISGYISYADYVVGTAGAIAGDLHAPLGSKVTFVCFSLGKASLPAFSKTVLIQTSNPVTDDLLYAKFNQTITTGNSIVSFAFKHQFSLVTVIAETNMASQQISAITCTLSPNYSGILDFSTNALTTYLSVTRIIPWGTIAAGQIVTALPCTVFTNGSKSITVSIPSVTIGGVTRTNFVATFGTNTMQAGYKYTLRLKFNIYEGPVFAGLTWAPGNLIGTSDGNGNWIYTFAVTQEYYSGTWNGGDSWGWCQLDPTVLTSYTGDYSATVDPCQKVAPAGTWRMPTETEFMYLKNSLGSIWTTRNGVYGRYFGTTDAALANANPKDYVFLPVAGYRTRGTTNMGDVGVEGHYWSATPSDAIGAWDLYFYAFGAMTTDGYRNLGFAIRCVK